MHDKGDGWLVQGDDVVTKHPERCPRCGGAAQVEEDHLGRFRSCLVCGWLEEVTHPLGEWELMGLPEEVWQRLAQLLGSEALGVKGSQQGRQWEG
jgi:ribosomal protein S27AE